MLDKKAFYLFAFIVFVGIIAGWWVQGVATDYGTPNTAVWTMIFYMGATLVIYLLIMKLTGHKSIGSSG